MITINQAVYQALQKRLNYIFAEFDNIFVAFSYVGCAPRTLSTNKSAIPAELI